MPLYTVSAEIGQVGQTLSTGNFKFTLPNIPFTLVHFSGWSSVDDTGLTITMQDDGVNCFTALDISDTDAAPAEFKTKHFGGTNDPVAVAGGSVMSIDLAAAAADSRAIFVATFLY